MCRSPEAVLEEQEFEGAAFSYLFFPPCPLLLSLQELYQPNAESLRQEEERKRLYQRQQERGGIIDLEAERNRYFISLQQVREGFPTPPLMPPAFLLPTPFCHGLG